LIIAACLGHACISLEECGERPTPVATPTPTPFPLPNSPPAISGFRVAPPEMFAGGAPAKVSATITDVENDGLEWSLAVDPSSEATGTFSRPLGNDPTVSSEFSPAPTSSGRAKLLLAVIDTTGASARAEITVFVVPRR
jgi:hypothetical protein